MAMINAKGINHIGIAVRSIADHHAFYEKTLGAEFEGMEDVPTQRVKVAFFRLGCVRLELLEPTDAEGPVAKFIAKHGEGLHHIAYSVDALDARLAELQINRVRLIDERPRPGAHHMQIAFLHPASSGGVLTELCEPATTHVESSQSEVVTCR
jgi:methylmalonyl-CoA/ethylmalonyl-CoA epimerase